MNVLQLTAPSALLVSCGVLVVNKRRQLLLCHVTGRPNFDIPKGVMDLGETTLSAAQRELQEETGLVLDAYEQRFEDLGEFPYLPTKNLHLFKVQAPVELENLDHLVCTSYFTHEQTGERLPEMDGFRWASREEVSVLCSKTMAPLLLNIDW